MEIWLSEKIYLNLKIDLLKILKKNNKEIIFKENTEKRLQLGFKNTI